MDFTMLIKTLDRMAPLEFASSWDNVGLLVEPTQSLVNTVLLTNDLTPVVVEEAVRLNAQLILSYHPPIFVPFKALRQQSWKERQLIRCLENKIGVYSPHTAWDAVQGGVNDWLASCVDYAKSRPIEMNTSNPSMGMGRRLTLAAPASIASVSERVKHHLKLGHVRLALGVGHSVDTLVTDIAICAGSGGSVLKQSEDVSLYLTGEMSHHEILDAVQRGVSVLLCEHSYSERGYLQHFAEKLRHETQGVSVHVSALDTGPLMVV